MKGTLLIKSIVIVLLTLWNNLSILILIDLSITLICQPTWSEQSLRSYDRLEHLLIGILFYKLCNGTFPMHLCLPSVSILCGISKLGPNATLFHTSGKEIFSVMDHLFHALPLNDISRFWRLPFLGHKYYMLPLHEALFWNVLSLHVQPNHF